MNRLFAAAGVDYVQWRALCRAYIWTDFATVLGVYGRVEARRALIRLVMGWLFLTALGMWQASIIWLARDPFLAAALTATLMMMWVGLTALTQSTTLVSTDDLAIVGFRPVSSRTYFAVRLTTLSLYVLEMIVIAGWLPIVAWLTRPDGGMLLALAGASTLTGASMAVTMGVVVLYGSLIRWVSPARLAMLLSYAGAMATLALTVGVTLAVNHFAESDTPGAFLDRVLARDWRTMWFPGAWFASYVPLVQGSRAPIELGAAALSVVTLIALGVGLRGRLAIAYAGRLAELTARTIAPSRGSGRAWSLIRGERRAVALLLANHLRADTRFQLSVGMNIIMALVITAIGSSFTIPVDPFRADNWERTRTLMMPMFALIFAPSQVYQSVVMTPSHHASWLFFTTPADRASIVSAGRDAIAGFVLLPTLLLLAVFFSIAYGHAGHALLHVAFIGGIAFAALQLNVLITPRLPFSVPFAQGGAPSFPILSNLLVLMIGMPAFALLQILAYQSGASLSVSFAGVALFIYVLDVLTKRRISRRSEALAYIG